MASLPVILLAGGCFSSPARSIAYYDLRMPEKVQKQSDFQLLLCGNDSPGRTRMLYRKADNRMVQDDYHCWIQTPEQMLMRYVNMAYPEQHTQDAATRPALRLTVNAFEFDLQSNEAVLSLAYEFKQGNQRKNGTVTLREKASDSSAAAFSAAMSKAVEKAVTQIAAAAK